jgi:hypothetical protein
VVNFFYRAARSILHLTSGNLEQPIEVANEAIYKNSAKYRKDHSERKGRGNELVTVGHDRRH